MAFRAGFILDAETQLEEGNCDAFQGLKASSLTPVCVTARKQFLGVPAACPLHNSPAPHSSPPVHPETVPVREPLGPRVGLGGQEVSGMFTEQ